MGTLGQKLYVVQLYGTHSFLLCLSSPRAKRACPKGLRAESARAVREAPDKKMPGLFGHCPNGGGVSTLAQMVWGTYFEKNCSCSKGHLLGLGGLNPCQDGLGHLCSEN